MYAWFESEEMAAKHLSHTFKLLVGERWTEEEKDMLEEGFGDVLKKGDQGQLIREVKKVGFEMIVWTRVG